MGFTSKMRDYLRPVHSMSPCTQRYTHGWRNQRTPKSRSRRANLHINRSRHHTPSPHHPSLTARSSHQRHGPHPTPLRILASTPHRHAKHSRQEQDILTNYSMPSDRRSHYTHPPHHLGLTAPSSQQRHHLHPTQLHILTPTVYPHPRDSRQDQGILANYSMLSNRRSHYIHSPHHLGLTAPSFQQRHHLRPTPLRILTPTVYPHPKDSRQDQGILANYSMRNSVPC